MYLNQNLKSLEEKQQGQKKKICGRKRVSNEFAALASIIRDGTGTQEEFEPNLCQEKNIGL